MDKTKIGVIGCGAMGLGVVEALLACDPRLQVAAICDPDSRSVNKALGALESRPEICPDYHEIMAMPDVQWVMIASWNCYQSEQVVAAFEAGKHVFCQKPIALSLDECVRMKNAWEASDERHFNVGFTLRYSPHYRKIKQLIDDGCIGSIISIEFNETIDFNHGAFIMGDWRRLKKNTGTHLLEKCCHDIDLVNWMLNSRANRVASFGGLDFFLPENAHHVERVGPRDDGKAAYGTWQGRGLVELDPFRADKDIVDNQVAIVEYENGVRATFHTNTNAAIPERRMYILGTEGAIRSDVMPGTIELRRIGWESETQDFSTKGSGGHGGGDKILARELADSMLDGVPPSVGLIEGLVSAVTCFAIDDAMDTGTVVDVTPYWEACDIGTTGSG